VVSFFFSSRRRHTRFSRDWSSDVCSSDLFFCSSMPFVLMAVRNAVVFSMPIVEIRYCVVATKAPEGAQANLPLYFGSAISSRDRSEERRVGKEWRRRRGVQQGTYIVICDA